MERYNRQEKRNDRRIGELIALIYNQSRDTKKDPEGIDWQDVFPEWKETKDEPKEQTDEEMFQVMMALTKRTQELTA
jgi:hypothetical protein